MFQEVEAEIQRKEETEDDITVETGEGVCRRVD